MAGNFNELKPGRPDPIVAAANEWPAFSAEHPDGVNQTAGVIINSRTGLPYRPQVVQEAYDVALTQINLDSAFGYQSPIGDVDFLNQFGRFAFGPENYAPDTSNVLAHQTLGGTGALWMAQEMLVKLIRRDETGRVPLLLEPGYGNHTSIFPGAQFNIATYQHVDSATAEYNHAAALEAIAAMPPCTPLLLQVCGHNDTGADRTKQQWDEILDAAQERNAVLVMDGAYIGLARGLADDVYPLTECIRRGLLTVACLSGSKIFGLYGERLGAMYIFNARQHLGDEQYYNLDVAYRADVRRTITGVPSLVAKVAAMALRNVEYRAQLEATRLRIRDNRAAFSVGAGKAVVGAANGWGLYTKVRPSGFSPEEVLALNQHGILVLQASRMNLGGMTSPEQAEWIGSVVANVVGDR